MNFELPTLTVDLATKYVPEPCYDFSPQGTLELKQPGALQEDIMTNENYILDGSMVTRLLQSVVTISKEDFDKLYPFDKDAILIGFRIAAFGSKYIFQKNRQTYKADLSTLKPKPLHPDYITGYRNNRFIFTCPGGTEATLEFKFLTHADEIAVQKDLESYRKLNQEENYTSRVRLKHVITSVNGNTDPKVISSFIDSGAFTLGDIREFNKYVKAIKPGYDMNTKVVRLDSTGKEVKGTEEDTELTLGANFLWT